MIYISKTLYEVLPKNIKDKIIELEKEMLCLAEIRGPTSGMWGEVNIGIYSAKNGTVPVSASLQLLPDKLFTSGILDYIIKQEDALEELRKNHNKYNEVIRSMEVLKNVLNGDKNETK